MLHVNRHFIKSLLRNFKAKPGIALLNIMGLSIGIAVFLLLFIYAEKEWSVDQFHVEGDQIYRIEHIRKRSGKAPYRGAGTFPGAASALREEFGEVESTCRVVPVWGRKGLLIYQEDVIESEYIHYVDTNFFTFFSFPLLEGDPSTALSNIHTAVIAKSVATKLFGETPCLGKTINLNTRDGEQEYLISGVYDDSQPTHLKADILFSWRSLIALLGEEVDNNWRYFNYITYFKVHPQSNVAALQEKLESMIVKYGGERLKDLIEYELQALPEIYLTSNTSREIAPNGNGSLVGFLMLIGLFILVIAWINYINLNTARATERAKEVGIKKILGAEKSSLLWQFLLEAALINLIAILIALLLLKLVSPFFSQFIQVDLPALSLLQLKPWLLLLTIWITSTLFSGFYPALFLSNFEPLKAVMERGGISSSGRMRKVLSTFQFLASAALIGGTFIVWQQLRFMNKMDVGVNTESVLVIDTDLFDDNERGHLDAIENYKNRLRNYHGVNEVSYSSTVVGELLDQRGSTQRISESNELLGQRSLINRIAIDPDYLDFYDIELLAGRNYSQPSDSQYVILNEAALDLYGFESPEAALDQFLSFTGLDTLQVIGVIENYYQESLREQFKPIAFLYLGLEVDRVSARISMNNLADFIPFAQREFERFFPNSTFRYALLDEAMALRHEKESNFLKLLNLASGLAIFIAILGLIGLSHFMVIKRQREVGIRKVLGSGVSAIVVLMFKDFARLVVIGNLLAIPVLYFGAQEWLNQFPFRIDFNWAIPIFVLMLSLLLTFLFVSFNLFRLAQVNPVEVLKEE